MRGDRIRPLLALLVLGSLAVLLRLYQIQVGQRNLWAAEALSLVQSGHEIPYTRGRILDTNGHVLARDKITNHVVLQYRDFRRGHGLGQVAHARSLLEGRPVPLAEARGRLEEWALELLSLTPCALQAFGRGEGLVAGSLEAAPLAEGRRQGRGRRAKDVAFYVHRLLPLEARDRRKVEKWAREEGRELTYLELAARALDEREPDRSHDAHSIWEGVRAQLVRGDERLARLAGVLEFPGALPGETPVERLVREIERVRRWVEDATAAKLFAEAAGFAPGRVEADTLVSGFDLDWIAELLAWDEARLRDWAVTAREGWRTNWRDGYALPRLMAQLRLEPAHEPGPDDVVARAATLFGVRGSVEEALNGAPLDWRSFDRLAVFDALDERFRSGRRRRRDPVRAPVLPVQDPTLRQAYPAGHGDWGLVDATWAAAGPGSSAAPAGLGEEIDRWLGSRAFGAGAELVDAVSGLVDRWDARFQAELRQRLVALSLAAGSEQGAQAPLAFAREHRDRAAERAEYFLKDYGRRTRSLVRGEPTYEVIYLLTRYGEDFPGFYAREAREREYPVLPDDATRAAPHLVGSVSSVTVSDLVGQREEARLMQALKANPDKTDAEKLELSRLVGRVLLEDEVKGISGIEGYWNRDLVGRNGYREVRGLQSLAGGVRRPTLLREAEDGEDVVTTLDTDLQRAARRTMRNPVWDDEPNPDRRWYANPVGAAVLLTIHGDVLAAASEPGLDSVIGEDPGEQRATPLERAFRAPSFQPPGSVFKPFNAAYALSELDYDPETVVTCGPIAKGGAGYVDVNCHNLMGHGDLSLHEALVHSCNAYFAALGERLTDPDLRGVASVFGLDAPTGVRTPPPWERGLRRRTGFAEDVGGVTPRARLGGGLSDHQRRLVGNGLAEITVTPMQLGRATIALATGELRDLRIVRRIGARELPYGAARPLPLAEAAIERVRAAMVDVALRGSAQRALAPRVLGLEVAAKTGSADLVRGDGDKVRKHTWVMGWLPAEDPVLAFVVFVHDTRQTSSHGAIYVARQLLHQPEVIHWLYEAGVDVSRVALR